MMSEADRKNIEAFRGELAVTIYVPSNPANSGTNPNLIEAKNLLRETEKLLRENGLRDGEVEDRLAPIRELLKSRDFASRSSGGYAIFAHPNMFASFRLPVSKEQVTIGETFDLGQLDDSNNNFQFYLLRFSQKSVSLLQGDEQGLIEILVPELPENLEETLPVDQPDKVVQAHGAARGGNPGSDAFHGHGGRKDKKDAQIEGYCREVDRHVSKVLAGKKAPLLFAGVEYEFAVYRKCCSYPHLVEQPLHGNWDRASTTELHAAALKFLGRG